MKKNLAFIVFLLVAPGSALSDESPSWWSLPDKGENCAQIGFYQTKKTDCGVTRVENWICMQPATHAFESGKATKYILNGIYESDVSNGCSPTYVVKEVVKERQ